MTFRILGTAGRDNALLVLVDSGQAVEQLLFDCGDGCLTELSFAEIKAIDHLFFSHLHMDHVGGFDSFFRCTFNRETKPNRVWGPPETARILQHRFQGFMWNLHEKMSASWLVSDVSPRQIHTTRFETREAFAVAHDEGSQTYERTICSGAGYSVETFVMDHRTPTLAYVVRESVRRNIDRSRIASLGLRPGPWLKQLKEPPDHSATVVVEGVTYPLDELRSALVVERPGDSIAYLTDFLLDDTAMACLSDALRGCRTLVCEGQYRQADLELARRNFHMTAVQAATLAQRAEVGELVLLHLSDRYERRDWIEILREAKQVFPNTHCPAQWSLEVEN